MFKKAVLGIASTELTQEEVELFKIYNPYGIILFKRNCANVEQLRKLTASIKDLMPNIKIFIDQEGGRVARLKEPEFREFPPANNLLTEAQAYDSYFIMGNYIKSLGIDINCAPVADLYYDYANNIIGDRSFGESVDQVVNLAKAAAKGLIDSGITPVIKHIPGHGRALVDSHLELPVIATELNELEKSDFEVFRRLNTMPMAMTAHIIYKALDPNLPVSISKNSIEYIRNKIGFKELLISDDINMKALKGDLGDLALNVLNAGCDLVLHCSGKIDEMRKVLATI